MEILDDTSANWLVRFSDGTTQTVAKSRQNQLLMDYNLWGLLRDGSEVYSDTTPDETRVTLIPGDDAREFTLRVGDFEPLHLGAHQKGDVVDALFEGKDPDSEPTVSEKLVSLFDSVRNQQVRAEVIGHFAALSVFDDIEEDNRGWLFNDHLLLTYDGEFYHPETTSRNRSGGVVEAGSNQEAYDLRINPAESVDREVTFGDDTYRLTDAEMMFLAKALWASQKAPTGVK